MKRRTLLVGGTALVGAAALGGVEVLRSTFVGATQTLSVRQKLTMPNVIDAQNAKRIDLVAGVGTTDFGTGVVSETAGFNGANLGPLLRIRSGIESPVFVSNQLSEIATVHWHGLLIDGAYDGGPHQPIESGKTWESVIKTTQSTSTAWYHSHVHGHTARQVYSGLAGMLFVDDGSDPDIGLPNTFGVDEFSISRQPLMCCWGFAGEPFWSMDRLILILTFQLD
jgi:blue copper oxidase